MTSGAHNDASEPTADPAVEAWLRRGQDAALPEVSADWGGLQRDLAAERGVGELRSLTTPLRVALVVLSAVLIVVAVLLATPRADLGVLPTGRFVADLVLLGAPLLLVVVTTLYPIHRPALRSSARWLAVGLAVTAVLLAVSLPAAHLQHPASLEGLGDDYLKRAFKCFAFGASVALPMLLVIRLVGRGGRGLRRFIPSILVAAGAVLVGMIGLYMHCPITAPSHLVAGHATVWIPFAALALIFGRNAADG